MFNNFNQNQIDNNFASSNDDDGTKNNRNDSATSSSITSIKKSRRHRKNKNQQQQQQQFTQTPASDFPKHKIHHHHHYINNNIDINGQIFQSQPQFFANTNNLHAIIPQTPPNSYQNTFYLDELSKKLTKTNLENEVNKRLNPNNNKNKKNNNQRDDKSSMSNQYDPYWEKAVVDIAIKTNQLIKSKLRINQRNYKDAFLTHPSDPLNCDIYIENLKDRNRALNGDIVAAKIKQKHLWKILDQFEKQTKEIVENFIKENETNEVNHENCDKKDKSNGNNGNNNNANSTLTSVVTTKQQEQVERNDKRLSLSDLTCSCWYLNEVLLSKLDDKWFQQTAYVVYIVEKKNKRVAAGHLRLFQDKNTNFALFSPNDPRMPRMQINMPECPPDFYVNSSHYEKSLFIAQIVDIPINSKYAIGTLKTCIGRDGDVNAETEAILIENGIDFSEFNEVELNSHLPQVPWRIPDLEFTYRRDLRPLCVFTIDPATARDLDDALHCIQLEDNLYEVGVHIADVSYFVQEESLIDKMACDRTTSVYLVQKVIPMLPRCLCENLCSLNPNEERLTFSVIWKITGDGKIVDEWFGRTIIKSAVKLSYDHAQKFIDNFSNSGNQEQDFSVEQFPPISERFSLDNIKESVLNLYKISKNLRQKRYDNGCLTLNQVKISFVLNKETFMPYGYQIYEQKDSNKLVEEFMLLANIAVAHRIYKYYPEKAILRRHPAPNQQQITQLAETIKEYGFNCDIRTSNAIQAFLHDLERERTDDSKIALITLTCLLTKTMQLAQYFCSSHLIEPNFHHYGLAVPLYTHFTSPIRRYPDILVHRLLAATLGYSAITERDTIYLQTICELCNEKKYSARLCAERSSEMYFAIFVNECGSLEENGYVTLIKDHSFDVLVANLGIVKRIYCDRLEINQENIEFTKNDSKPQLKFTWKATDKHKNEVKQTINLFSKVKVVVTKHDFDSLKYNVVLKHPNDGKEVKQSELDTKELNENDIYKQQLDYDPYICD